MTYLKWIGNKSKLMKHLRVPDEFNNMHDPFCGSASPSLYVAQSFIGDMFSTSTAKYFISDVNHLLINCHNVVKYKLPELFNGLDEIQNKDQKLGPEEVFASCKLIVNNKDIHNDVELAIAFIYLNRRSYGGMWRENKKGKFNAPLDKEQLFNLSSSSFKGRLKKCSKLFSKFSIICQEYKEIQPVANDFVFLDPPYYPKSDTANFTNYNACGWDIEKHNELMDFLVRLDNSDIKFLMTNTDCEYIKDKCSKFNLSYISTPRYIDALKYRDGTTKMNRDNVNEVVVTNYRVGG